MPELQSIGTTSVDHLRLLLEHTQIGIWELNLETGQAWRNRRHDEIFGYPELLPEWTYEMFLEHVVEKDREEVDRRQSEALEKNEEWSFECGIIRSDGQQAWIHAVGKPLFDEAGKPIKLIGHVIDITSTKRKEDRLRLVTEELNHRVRNILAMIRAMVKLSARGSDDIATFAQSLEGRVGALARTHDLLVRETDAEMSLSRLISKHLDAFPNFADRVRMTGDCQTVLSNSQAQSLSLIIHELLTNAIKYGSLSVEKGQVELAASKDGDKLEIVWRESGGPRVEPPSREGFGSQLISRAIGSEGIVELDYAPSGFTCRIEM